MNDFRDLRDEQSLPIRGIMAEITDPFFVHGNTGSLLEQILTLTVPKSALLTLLSLLLGVAEMGLVIADFKMAFTLPDRDILTEDYTEPLLVFLVLSFWCALLGFVYAVQLGHRKTSYSALISLLANFSVSVTRLYFEMKMMKFRKEHNSLLSENALL